MTDFASVKGEIQSWIENEQQCVTALRIAQTFSVSRQQASEWLQELLGGSDNYQVAGACEQVKEEHVTGKLFVPLISIDIIYGVITRKPNLKS